jgi:hypothetical protein
MSQSDVIQTSDVEEQVTPSVDEVAEIEATPVEEATHNKKTKKKKKQEDTEVDDDFGNRIDYVPSHGHGGIYREPMSGGTSWNRGHRRNHRHQRHQRHNNYEEQEGVLTIRQPGWKDQAESGQHGLEQEQGGVLTIRQQGELARSLRWQQKQQHTYISKPDSNGRSGARNNRDNGGKNGQRKNNRKRRKQNNRGSR